MRLTIPAALAVTALGLGCPADDGGDSGNDVGTGSATATSSSSATEASSSSATETSTSGESSSSTGIELPDCTVHEDEAACGDEMWCAWITGLGCRPDCALIDNRTTCVESDFCYWFEDVCNTPI